MPWKKQPGFINRRQFFQKSFHKGTDQLFGNSDDGTQPCGRLYVHWYRRRNNAFARLDLNHQSLDPSGAVNFALVSYKIQVNIRITFFTKKKEQTLGRALKVGFEDSRGYDHWENREA